MSRKQEQPSQRKKSHAPSTGLGAASAMEAMIKRRLQAPQPQHPPRETKKH